MNLISFVTVSSPLIILLTTVKQLFTVIDKESYKKVDEFQEVSE
jgi:hypothetical protein